MKLRSIIVTSLATMALVSSCGDGNQDKPAEDSAAIPVQVSSLTPSGGTSDVQVSGRLEALQSANISTRIMGYVQRLRVQPGDKVKKGSILVEINSADISAKQAQVRANIIAAEAAFSNAEKDYKRYTALYESQSASQKEMDDISAHYQMAKAQLEAARQMEQEVQAQLAYVRIKSPFDGVVTNTFVKDGDLAHPGRPLLEVESPDQFQVVAMVPESEISEISADMEVKVNLKSLGKWVAGRVSEVSSSSKNTGGQYLVKVVLQHVEDAFKSGMYATVVFPVEEPGSVTTFRIPSDIIVRRGQLSGVYTVSSQDKASLRWLRLGNVVGDSVTVLSGLNAQDRIIYSAEGKLFNGARVQVQ